MNNPWRSTFQQRLDREARRWFWTKVGLGIGWCVALALFLAWLRWITHN